MPGAGSCPASALVEPSILGDKIQIIGETRSRWRRGPGENKLMRRKAWPLIGLKHVIGEVVTGRDVEIRLQIRPDHEEYWGHRAICRLLGLYTGQAGAVHQPSIVLRNPGSLIKVPGQNRRPDEWG